jgi:hypothetical protein
MIKESIRSKQYRLSLNDDNFKSTNLLNIRNYLMNIPTFIELEIESNIEAIILSRISNIQTIHKDKTVATLMRADLIARQAMITHGSSFLDDFITNGFNSEDIPLYEESINCAVDLEISRIISGDIEMFLSLYPNYEAEDESKDFKSYRNEKVELMPKSITIPPDVKTTIELPDDCQLFNVGIRLFTSEKFGFAISGDAIKIIKQTIISNYNKLNPESSLKDISIGITQAPFGYHISDKDRDILNASPSREVILKVLDKYIDREIRIILDILFSFNDSVTTTDLHLIANDSIELLS